MALSRSYDAGSPRRRDRGTTSRSRSVSSTTATGFDYSTTFPKHVVLPPPSDEASTLSAAELHAFAHDPVVIANRARLAHFRQLRSKAPNDVSDGLQGTFWFLFVLAGFGTAFNILLEFDLLWAAAGAVLAVVVGTTAMMAFIDAREREMWRASGHRVAPDPEWEFHWRLLTPGSIFRRAKAHVDDMRNRLDALSVDDSELEEALEPLYRHGTTEWRFRR
jgi:hypothetical protein